MTAHLRLAVLLLAVSAPLGATVAEDEPRLLLTEVTERLVQEAAHHGDALRQQPERAYGLAEEVIGPRVDFLAIARRVLGPHWREAKAEEREQFAREYRTFVLRALVTGFVEHLDAVPRYGARLSYLPTRWSADGRDAVVRGRLALDSGVPLDLEFRLHRSADAWKVYDVSVAGVSLVQANQASFARELSAGGLAGLTARLAAHNRALDGAACCRPEAVGE
jgi:phospholipid transport system substrate-binding protein